MRTRVTVAVHVARHRREEAVKEAAGLAVEGLAAPLRWRWR